MYHLTILLISSNLPEKITDYLKLSEKDVNKRLPDSAQNVLTDSLPAWILKVLLFKPIN